jgi:cobalt-zinc-cadmium efflux system membrane fusion protein
VSRAIDVEGFGAAVSRWIAMATVGTTDANRVAWIDMNKKWTSLCVMAGAVVIGGSALVLAETYTRPEPTPAAPHVGMTVGSDTITLSDEAPQWAAITIAPAKGAEARWSDPVPARVVFDETRTSRLGTPLAGRLSTLMIERGQRVTAGDKLFTVASPSLAELRSEQQKALVEKASAKINLDRTQALVDAGSLPGKELVAAKQTLVEADLAVSLAQQKLSALKVTTSGDSSFTVTAPRSGVVVEMNLAVGQEVDSSTGSLLAISDLSDVWIVADVFESDLGKLTEGAKARVVLADDGETEGTIDRISSVVDPDRHTIPVRVKLVNSTGALRPNSHVRLRFLDTTPAKVAVPATAVISDGTASFVYVREKGTLRKRKITLGPVHAGVATIVAGVEPGEQIVVRGATLLDNQIELDN